MSRFLDRLEITEAGSHNGSEIFRLLRPLRFESDYDLVEVPAGFETDGASVPRAFWAIFPPYGPYFRAAVVHDFLYSVGNTRFYRYESDDIFLEAMESLGVPWVKRHIIYRAVRWFGWAAFKGNPR